MNWQPIETYDALEKKPKHAAFYFKAKESDRGAGGYRLGATVELTRIYGSRVCTHWCPLPDTDGLDKGGEGMSENPTATWSISLDVYCPECKDFVDLTIYDDFWVDRDNLEVGQEAQGVDVVCPQCGHEFKVNTEY